MNNIFKSSRTWRIVSIFNFIPLFLLVPLGVFAAFFGGGIEAPNPALIPSTSINRIHDFYTVICVATSWIIVFGIIIGALFIVYGGVKYITSAGESSKEEEAKGTIKTAIIGVVFLILAVALVRIVASFFGGDITLDIINCPS